MRKLLFPILLGALPLMATSQTLTQSAEDKSSLLAKGSLISIDIAKTDIGFGINNLHRSVGEREKFVWGASVKAANEEGLATLFSKGDLTPSSSLKGFAGWSWSNGINPNIELQKAAVNERVKTLDAEYIGRLKDRLQFTIDLYKTQLGKLHNKLKDYIDKGEALEDIATMVQSDEDDDESLAEAKKKILDVVKEWGDDYKTEQEELQKNMGKLYNKEAALPYMHGYLFAFGGVDALKFKQFTGVDTVTLSGSFQDRNFQGGSLGIGANFQYRNLLFGASYAYVSTNSFKLLTSRDYTLRTTNAQGNQNLIQEKKINAYTGAWDKVEINEFNFDFGAKVSLDKKSTNHLLINPYVHAQLSTRNKDVLPNSLDAGCGFYFFQQTGKFLGGFYIELPDVENNYEKMKPENEQTLRTPAKRMTFGIVAKFSLQSFAGLF